MHSLEPAAAAVVAVRRFARMTREAPDLSPVLPGLKRGQLDRQARY